MYYLYYYKYSLFFFQQVMSEILQRAISASSNEGILQWGTIDFTASNEQRGNLYEQRVKRLKSSRFNTEIYKETWHYVQRTIKQKKKRYLEKKLSENIAKPKELWETLKSLGLPNKKSSPSNICLKYKNGSLFESLSIAGNFKRYYYFS